MIEAHASGHFLNLQTLCGLLCGSSCVQWLRFSWNRKAIETSNLVETWHCTRVTRRANLKSEVAEGHGHWERKYKNRFSRISSSKMDQFTSKQDQNDIRSILHIGPIVEYISSTEMFRFVIICNQWLSGRAACRRGHLAVYLLVEDCYLGTVNNGSQTVTHDPHKYWDGPGWSLSWKTLYTDGMRTHRLPFGRWQLSSYTVLELTWNCLLYTSPSPRD